jgi:hypothetical protein
MRKLILLGLSLLLTLGLSINLNAATYELPDTLVPPANPYWDSWVATIFPYANTHDVIGLPDITMLKLNTNPLGYLQSVEVDLTADPSLYGGLRLFIDSTGDQKWDYYLIGNELYNVTASVSIAKGVNDSAYILSNDYMAGLNETYRDGSPIGIINNDLGSKYIVGYSYSSGVLLLDFSNTGIQIPIGGSWIGSTVGCANDVTLNRVPEPSTLLFLGTGLIILTRFRRKKL